MSGFQSTLRLNRPSLFSPKVTRNVMYDSANDSFLSKINFSSITETSLSSSGSFKYDLSSSGLKSSQQLNVDWSKFENHTFFNSAIVNVNVAFDRIINTFPFDGSKKETENWFSSLTGFEKHVYDQFPKNNGYMFFSGTKPSEDTNGTKGTFISVTDRNGVSSPLLSRTTTAEPVLDFTTGSASYEMQLFIPEQANANQVVFQKMGNNHGVALVLLTDSSTTECDAMLVYTSGAAGMVVTGTVEKGSFNHICGIINRESPTNSFLELFINEASVARSTDDVAGFGGSIETGLLSSSFTAAPLIIGSGSTIQTPVGAFVPTQTFSGAVDEFRVFHEVRNKESQSLYAEKAIFSVPSLKLYYKFNEPLGNITGKVLDSSGNSLHADINPAGYALGVRNAVSASVAVVGVENPMRYENLQYCPVLFSNDPAHQALHDTFSSDAALYDQLNPNLITKLIPPHYLLNGQAFEGLSEVEGAITGQYGFSSEARGGTLGGTQLLLSLLYTYAKFFDELKINIDAFSNLFHVNYDNTDTVPDNFLQFLASHYGISLPPIFNDTTIAQYVDGDNFADGVSLSENSLQYIQNQIWRRILTNVKDLVQSKGTLHSVKSFIRSVGIDPDSNFRIREYGGPNKGTLQQSRDLKTEITTLAQLSDAALIYSPYLSGSRVEPGYPEPRGTFVSGISNNASDGLFTSGSWSYEGIYKFEKVDSLTTGHLATQSLGQFLSTGSLGQGLLLNVIATTYPTPKIRVYGKPVANQLLDFELIDVDIFDGNVWNISIGRNRYDAIDNVVSSSYFLRAARQEGGEILENYETSSYYRDGVGVDHFSTVNSTLNASGTWISFGDKTIASVASTVCLNDGTITGEPLVTEFDGKLGHLRFWSKGLTKPEWEEHVRNYKSVGVENPNVNFNFDNVITGSFERLRFDVSTDQAVTSSNGSGEIQFFDFSQNNFHLSGSGYDNNSQVIVPERISFSFLSPKFDEFSAHNKVRIRGFQSYENAVEEGSYAEVGPVYNIEPSEQPNDNTRFTIDFSVIDALDQDMVKIFATFDSLDNALGNPELLFSPDYPRLEAMRKIYFNRLTDNVNLKSFFEFFKWFDSSMSVFIEQLLPRKTKFFGCNYVISGHMLEAQKVQYLYSNMYIGVNNRSRLVDTILLQQFTARLKKF